MKRMRIGSLVLLVLLSTLLFPNPSAEQSETEDIGYFLKSTLRYSNPSNVQVWNLTEREEDRTVSLFMNNTWQTVELLNSTLPIERIENDEDGNPVAVLKFPETVLSQGENVTFTVWYHIVSKPRIMPIIDEDQSLNLSRIPQSLVDEYTREEGSWQTNDSTLRTLAFDLMGSETKVLTIIKNFIEWIRIEENISYPKGRHENPYYPNQTYAFREGDCDDQAILLVTLCRIVGIPSYLQTGCIYLPNRPLVNETLWNGRVTLVQRRIGWHGWAAVYVPPWGWLPVDLTYVQSSAGDPLSSIRSGAVTTQDTIQYMNVTHTDYVASSLETRAFVTENGFNVYVEDEMILENEQKLPAATVEPWLPLVFLALMVFLVATSFLIFRRWMRKNIRRDTGQQ